MTQGHRCIQKGSGAKINELNKFQSHHTMLIAYPHTLMQTKSLPWTISKHKPTVLQANLPQKIRKGHNRHRIYSIFLQKKRRRKTDLEKNKYEKILS